MTNYQFQVGDSVEFVITPDGQWLDGTVLEADHSGEVSIFKIEFTAKNEGGNIATTCYIGDVPNTLLKQKEI